MQILDIEIEHINDPPAPHYNGACKIFPISLTCIVFLYAISSAAQQGELGITQHFAIHLVYHGKVLAYTVVPMPANTLEWETTFPTEQEIAPIPG